MPLDSYYTVLKKHLCKKKNVLAELFNFIKDQQKPDKNIKDYYASIKGLVIDCKFNNGMG